MEIPDPVPEIVIAIPKRGKMRVTTVEEADALIAQAVKAKVMLLAAKAAIDPADPGVPAHDEAAPVPVPPPCGQRAPDNSPGECARFEGHRPPHRNLAGFEWGEEEGEDAAPDVASGLDPFAIPPNRIGSTAMTRAVPHCGARWPNLGPAGGEWECTLDAAHDGAHEARLASGKRAADPSAVIAQDDPAITAEPCPDCGRASCTGDGCYWPDEAGIARPEASRP